MIELYKQIAQVAPTNATDRGANIFWGRPRTAAAKSAPVPAAKK
jgi:hypothetical protein